jgi:hypothetical protein
MNITFSETGGVRMATLPAADLDRLIEAAEDRADIAAAERAARRRAEGEEYLPAEMARRIIAGESPLRVWRGHRGLTLQLLGAAAGIKPSYLSEIELGKKPGTPAIWRKLAKGLDVTVDDIMPDND